MTSIRPPHLATTKQAKLALVSCLMISSRSVLKTMITAVLLYRYGKLIKSFILCTFCKSISTILVMRKKYGRVQHLPFNLVFKLTRLDTPEEAKTIQFIADQTTIPLPKIVLSTTGFWRHYMIMKRVDGKLLIHAWHTMSQEQRKNILSHLREIVQQLRSIPNPCPSMVAGPDHGPCLDSRAANDTFGPFESVAEFNDYLVSVTERYDDTDLALIRSQMEDHPRIFFTHGDLAPRNIFVKGDKVAAIIDWENAGWFPEHWEYVKAKHHHEMKGDWDDSIRDFIPSDCEAQYQVDKRLSSRIYGAFIV